MQPQALARGVRPAGRSPRGARLHEEPERHVKRAAGLQGARTDNTVAGRAVAAPNRNQISSGRDIGSSKDEVTAKQALAATAYYSPGFSQRDLAFT